MKSIRGAAKRVGGFVAESFGTKILMPLDVTQIPSFASHRSYGGTGSGPFPASAGEGDGVRLSVLHPF